jgi:ABC-2 type transport system permease protein
MSTTVEQDLTGTTAARAKPRPATPKLTFLRAVRSEWIKLTSLRSSIVLLALTVEVMAGIGALNAWGISTMADGLKTLGGAEGLSSMARGVPAVGAPVAQMLIASLAVMQIGSEFGNGMIRTTLTVVPRRITALLAKTLVMAAAAFVVGVVGALASWEAGQLFLKPAGLGFGVTADGVIPSILAAGGFLALIAVFGISVGALLRHSAGGIMTALGVLLVLPVVAAMLSQNETVAEMARYLPSHAGLQMVAIETEPGDLTSGQAWLVMLGWAAAPLVLALASMRRRDV